MPSLPFSFFRNSGSASVSRLDPDPYWQHGSGSEFNSYEKGKNELWSRSLTLKKYFCTHVNMFRTVSKDGNIEIWRRKKNGSKFAFPWWPSLDQDPAPDPHCRIQIWSRNCIETIVLKAHICLEYHSVCPVVRIEIYLPPLSLTCVSLPPEPKGGGDTRLRMKRWGVPIRRTGEKV